MRSGQFWLLLLVLVLVCGSSFQVVYQSHEVRQLHTRLQSLQRQQDELLAEYSRLLLERGSVASYQNVERIATGELAMQFPVEVERVEP